MKLTNTLLKQNIGWYFKKHWAVQGKLKVYPTAAQQILSEKGIPVYDPNDLLFEQRKLERVEVIGYKPQPIKNDETHPNWHEKVLLTYKDNNVLLEGLNQAKLLTNTVEVKKGLPDNYQLNPLNKGISSNIKNIILNSHVFDAEQQKLPKIKDPNRPAFNFPRVYGITQKRSSKSLVTKLLQLIECTQSLEIVQKRSIFNDLVFVFTLKNGEDLIQFEVKAETVLTSQNPLFGVSGLNGEGVNLPDIQPLKSTISLNEENIYKLQDIYPFTMNVKARHPHTIFINYNTEEVKNLFEEEVTENQIFSRSLMKTFTVAASYAKQQFGNDIKLLPRPVAVQCVHTDGKFFHFGVLQLNTLDLNSKDVKNVWHQTEKLNLFNECKYYQGKPILEGYNSQVIQHLITFYNRL